MEYRQNAGPGAEGERPGPRLWRLLSDAVERRGIPVSLETEAVELLRTSDGRVDGAVVERGGERRSLRAAGGVVLVCGSFEADEDLRDAHLPLVLTRIGHPHNTGGSLRMAQQVGASLWHMSTFFGWLVFRHPDFEAGFPLDVHAPSFVYVDADGRRFADETGHEAHDRVRCLTNYSPRRANHPKLPGYIVFDEAARLAGPLNGVVGTPNDYAWSPDNSVEVERGWIRRGDSPRGLAEAVGVDATVLEATLASYNAAAMDGRDHEFGRSPETLAPLEEASLYAIEFWPGVATASGGPRRDAQARVLRPNHEPIAGLYAAGAAGSIWGHLTEHGGGLTDAMVFGRIAGREAAASLASA